MESCAIETGRLRMDYAAYDDTCSEGGHSLVSGYRHVISRTIYDSADDRKTRISKRDRSLGVGFK